MQLVVEEFEAVINNTLKFHFVAMEGTDCDHVRLFPLLLLGHSLVKDGRVSPTGPCLRPTASQRGVLGQD